LLNPDVEEVVDDCHCMDPVKPFNVREAVEPEHWVADAFPPMLAVPAIGVGSTFTVTVLDVADAQAPLCTTAR
jgi:hypothetical protein